MILDDSAYSTKFYDIVHSHDRYIIAFGGRGSGKTDSFYLKYLLETYQPYYFKLCYVNKEKANIRDQQYAGFKRVAKRLNLPNLKFYDGDYRIINEITGNSLIPKGMDDPEKTKGLDDITAIWWDEVNKGSQDDFTTLNALLRSPVAQYLQFAISFNPVSEQHWLRTFFFDKDNPYELNDIFKSNTLLNHSTYLDNEFIDQDEYLNTLLQNSNGNVNRSIVDIKGLWGVEQNDNPFFYMLSSIEMNFDEYTPSNQHELLLSFDFNHSPTTCIVAQKRPDLKKVFVFDIIIADINTSQNRTPIQAVCDKIKIKYGNITSYLYRVTGDGSGTQQKSDRIANTNFYTDIMKELALSQSHMTIKANIKHSLSGDICNSVFQIFGKSYVICGNTQILQNEIKQAYADKDGSLNSFKKDNGGHFTDAFRYLNTNLIIKTDGIDFKRDIKHAMHQLTGIFTA